MSQPEFIQGALHSFAFEGDEPTSPAQQTVIPDSTFSTIAQQEFAAQQAASVVAHVASSPQAPPASFSVDQVNLPPSTLVIKEVRSARIELAVS